MEGLEGLGTTLWGKADLGCDLEGWEHLQGTDKGMNKVQGEAVGKTS